MYQKTMEDDLIQAYRHGLKADVLQEKQQGQWGPLWTIPPCSPTAMERAGQQLTRSRCSHVRHYRRAMLRMQMLIEPMLVMIETELPTRQQRVSDIETGIEVRVPIYLEDTALAALETAFVALPASSESIVTDEPSLHRNAATKPARILTLRL